MAAERAAERKARRTTAAPRAPTAGAGEITSTDSAQASGPRGAGAKGGNAVRAPSLQVLPGYLLDDGNADILRLVNERVRLGILSALAVNDRLAFADLKATLAVTDGNLSVHARKLEEAGYILCRKRVLGRRPCTEFTLTERGRRGFERYLGHMESLIHQLKGRT